MPSNPDFEKKALDKKLRDKYPEGTTNYHELREILADENTPIINTNANNFHNPVDTNYNAANRTDKLDPKVSKTLQKKRCYGIIVYAGKNIYVDIPHRSEHPLDRPDVYASGELNLQDYQASIFYLPKSLAEETPPEGSLVSVEIPDNFPNHTETNPYDAVILDIYEQVVSPSILANPTPIAGSGDSGALGAGGAGGCGPDTPSPPSDAPASQVEAANGYDKMVENFGGKSFLFTKPKDKAAAPVLIFYGGMLVPWANREAMEQAAPEDLKKRIFCIWLNSPTGQGPADSVKIGPKELQAGIDGIQKKHNIKFTSYKICGFSEGGAQVHISAKSIGPMIKGSINYDFVGLVDPYTTSAGVNAVDPSKTKIMFGPGNWPLPKYDEVQAAYPLWKSKLGSNAIEVKTGHRGIPKEFMEKFLTELTSGPSQNGASSTTTETKKQEGKKEDPKTTAGSAVSKPGDTSANAKTGTTSAASSKTEPSKTDASKSAEAKQSTDKGKTTEAKPAAGGANAKDAKTAEKPADAKAAQPDASKAKQEDNTGAKPKEEGQTGQPENTNTSLPPSGGCVGGGGLVDGGNYDFSNFGGATGEGSRAAISPTVKPNPPYSIPKVNGICNMTGLPDIIVTDDVYKAGVACGPLIVQKIPKGLAAGEDRHYTLQAALGALVKLLNDLRGAMKGVSGVDGVIKNPYVTSGYRTTSKQKQVSGATSYAAAVGVSSHQNATAIDFCGLWSQNGRASCSTSFVGHKPGSGPSYEWMKQNAVFYGFRRTELHEAWHWEFREQWLINPTKGLVFSRQHRRAGSFKTFESDGQIFGDAHTKNIPGGQGWHDPHPVGAAAPATKPAKPAKKKK